ncbi:MAG: GntR family transcriptional regulator [Hyphomicrobiales bacterium]|nr:GntR family transcriptional regulator [Hyphomicrobiales bacterium]
MYERSDNPTALPIYIQISEVLIREIAAGRLVDGERLPPERVLARRHGTTVRTLRKALAVLEKKEFLDRRQGSGNYVRSSSRIESVYSMFRLELRGGGGLPTAAIIDVEECNKPDDLPGFGTSGRATRIRRLRFLNALPIAVEEIWLDRDAGEIDRRILSDSLYQYYKVQLGFWITRAEDFVSIDRVPDWAPETFSVNAAEVSGYVERFSWAQMPAPVEYSRTWFDTDRAFYVQRLK